MSDTPRTDVAESKMVENTDGAIPNCVMSEFARTLERELIKCNQAYKLECEQGSIAYNKTLKMLLDSDDENEKLQSQLITAQEGARQIELRANEEARDLSAQIVTAQKTIGEMREALEKAKIKHTFKL